MKFKATILIASGITIAFSGLLSVNAQTWSLVFSNSMDGWKGPVAVAEESADGSRTLRTIPIQYQPFNTNTVFATNYFSVTNISVTNVPAINSNAIKQAVESGLICSVRGHQWEGGCGVIGCCVIHGDAPMRHCVICNKTETRELGPWK